MINTDHIEHNKLLSFNFLIERDILLNFSYSIYLALYFV